MFVQPCLKSKKRNNILYLSKKKISIEINTNLLGCSENDAGNGNATLGTQHHPVEKNVISLDTSPRYSVI